MNPNVIAASTMAVVGILILGVGTYGLSVFRPTYSLPNAQVQLVLDPTCYYNQCTLTQQPTASPPSFAATTDALGIVESPFVVQSYSVGVGTAVQNCGFGSGTILTPTTVIYPPTYSVLVNGQKVGSVPNFFGQATVCGRTGIANFGYNYQPFWLNFTGCGVNGCGTVQFAVGYAPSMTSTPLCYPTGISGNMLIYPGATPTNAAGCSQSQPAASYYSPLAPTTTATTTQSGVTTTVYQTTTVVNGIQVTYTTTATVTNPGPTTTATFTTTQTSTQTITTTTAFTYTTAGTTTTMLVTVTTTQAAPSSTKLSLQALGVGMLILSAVVLYLGREEQTES